MESGPWGLESFLIFQCKFHMLVTEYFSCWGDCGLMAFQRVRGFWECWGGVGAGLEAAFALALGPLRRRERRRKGELRIPCPVRKSRFAPRPARRFRSTEIGPSAPGPTAVPTGSIPTSVTSARTPGRPDITKDTLKLRGPIPRRLVARRVVVVDAAARRVEVSPPARR